MILYISQYICLLNLELEKLVCEAAMGRNGTIYVLMCQMCQELVYLDNIAKILRTMVNLKRAIGEGVKRARLICLT